jgi:hypothetical protein
MHPAETPFHVNVTTCNDLMDVESRTRTETNNTLRETESIREETKRQ